MLRRGLVVLLVALGAWSLVATAVAHDEHTPVVVLEIEKPADQRLMDWVADELTSTDAHVFVLQVNSPGISSGDPSRMYRAVAEARAPVVVWVGAAPAFAGGGMASLANLADVGAAAPTVRFGYLTPTVQGSAETAPLRADHPADEATEALSKDVAVVTEPIPGYIDVVVPTVGQLIVDLDGTTITRPDGSIHALSTATRTTAEDGSEIVVLSRLVEFKKPGLFDRFLRLAAEPETAFFFLVAGIAAATFEFYAAGVGITAAIAVVALFLSGYGMATLPMNWLAVGSSVVGLWLFTWDFQRARVGWRTALGALFLLGGGLTFTTARPQFAPVWWIVVAVVIGAILFYTFALSTIARSRFSTTTIGRGDLIGRTGIAETDFDPEGVVDVDGARWRGRSHREAGIKAGVGVRVIAIDGVVLDIEPLSAEDEGVRD